MKRFQVLFILVVFSFIFHTISLAQQASMDWILATDSVGWSGRYLHTSVVFDNKIWVIGGLDFGFNRKNDVWYSSDGINWTCATANAGWSARSGHASVVFDNKIWVIGGYSDWYPRNDIWYSSDGINWTCTTANAAWSVRSCHTSFVFDNKMWVIGGSPDTNDVWYSSDGINWTCATANAGWSARDGHTSVVFDNKMWVIGGFPYTNDVWYSSNGINWTEATASAGWSARYLHASVVYDNKIWVMGGVPGNNDVLYSSNGTNWTRPTANADHTAWSARYGQTLVVFDNKPWLIGGYSHMNEVWYSRIMSALISPNGGEIWPGRSHRTIRWHTVGTGFARHKLLLSTNDGSSYPYTIINTVTPNETTYYWTVLPVNSTTCRVMVQILDTNGLVMFQDASDGNFTIITNAIEEVGCENTHLITTLHPISPNPIRNANMRISFSLEHPQNVVLKIYDNSGKLLKIIVKSYLGRGIYYYTWDCKNERGYDQPNGIYFVRLETKNYDEVKKLLILR
jgi:hypothetical protein